MTGSLTTTPTLARRLAAEGVGTALLLAIVVGSGIMGQRLAAGNDAVALLANALATGCGLVVLILVFGDVSGAHLNPVVTLSAAWRRLVPWRDVGPYVAAQVVGALAGVVLAHAMFGLPWVSASRHVRDSGGEIGAEVVASAGLLLTIMATRRRPMVVPFAVAAYIVAAYWFTSSTSFANPAVTLARALTDTFAGIAPGDVLPFVGAQVIGALGGTAFATWMEGRA